MNQDQKDVIAAIQTMTQAFHEGDLARVMDSYEPEATVVFEPGVPVSHRAGLEEGFRKFFSISPRFTYGEHAVTVCGDVATHFAPWTMRGTAPDGSAIEDHGLTVAVLRRQPDGRWRMIIDVPYGDYLLRKTSAAE